MRVICSAHKNGNFCMNSVRTRGCERVCILKSTEISEDGECEEFDSKNGDPIYIENSFGTRKEIMEAMNIYKVCNCGNTNQKDFSVLCRAHYNTNGKKNNEEFCFECEHCHRTDITLVPTQPEQRRQE